jgi:hypothetical protein
MQSGVTESQCPPRWSFLPNLVYLPATSRIPMNWYSTSKGQGMRLAIYLILATSSIISLPAQHYLFDLNSNVLSEVLKSFYRISCTYRSHLFHSEILSSIFLLSLRDGLNLFEGGALKEFTPMNRLTFPLPISVFVPSIAVEVECSLTSIHY